MTKSLLAMLLAASVVATGCQYSTAFGECVGILDDKDPDLVYEASIRNIVVGSIFLSTVFVPAIVVATQLQCPTDRKAVTR